jgi:thymidylate synthase
MYVIHGHNYRSVLYESLRRLEQYGRKCMPRGKVTIEIESTCLVIDNPRDRVALLQGRQANIFSTLAETIWVLAGRNDLSFISYYLKSIANFSDDGVSLHGAYGPRLRNWKGVDQVMQVYQLLYADPDTRRAVISLFDPECDFDNTRRDIPCNNWLQFLIRDGKLNLHVVSRSMDVIWGSTINVFEWTVLQEIMATWLGIEMGSYVHYIGSLHIYEEFTSRSQAILSYPLDLTEYACVTWNIPMNAFDACLQECVEVMSVLQKDVEQPVIKAEWPEIIQVVVRMMWVYALHKSDRYEEAWYSLHSIDSCDLIIAGESFLLRNPNYKQYIEA